MNEFEERVLRFRARKSPDELQAEALSGDEDGAEADKLREEESVRSHFAELGYLTFLEQALEFARREDGKEDARLVFEMTRGTDPRFPDVPLSQEFFTASLQWDIVRGSVSDGCNFATMELMYLNRFGSIRAVGQAIGELRRADIHGMVMNDFVAAYHLPDVQVPINGIHPENTSPASS